MDSQQLIDILKTVIATDSASPTSVIDYFLTHNMSGGWEGWLQVVYARGVVTAAQNAPSDYNREVPFPGTTQRCDLWFQAARGTGLWVELKTQRFQNYPNTVADFSGDIGKLTSLSQPFRSTNILVAAVYLTLGAHGPNDDRKMLDAIRTRGFAGKCGFWSCSAAGVWTDQTQNMANVPLGLRILATFVPT
jgi:hypothetical protein